eukprot:2943386-Pyramimonas_sp.AAC.1
MSLEFGHCPRCKATVARLGFHAHARSNIWIPACSIEAHQSLIERGSEQLNVTKIRHIQGNGSMLI